MNADFFGIGDPSDYTRTLDWVGAHAVQSSYDRIRPQGTMSQTELDRDVSSMDLSTGGTPLKQVLAETAQLYAHETVQYHHSRYVAHLNCPVLLSSVAADTLLAGLNTAVETWDQSRSAALMERRLIAEASNWCGFTYGDGVFTSGGSASNQQAMLLARGNALEKLTGNRGIGDIASDQLSRLRIFTSQTAHYSIAKSAGILGLSKDAIVPVATDDLGRLRPDALRQAILDQQAKGNVAMAIVATIGSTDRGSIDPVADIAAIAREYDVWLHVDGAIGGVLSASPATKYEIAGIDDADSVTLDFHKTFFLGVACSAIIVREASSLRHIEMYADYLNRQDTTYPDQAAKSIQTTRRFDALKLWLTLRQYGTEKIVELFNACRASARTAAELLRSMPSFEVMEEPQLNMVLFRYVNPGLTKAQRTAVQRATRAALMESGDALIACTTVDGDHWWKFTLLNPTVTRTDLAEVVQLVDNVARTNASNLLKNRMVLSS